MKDLWDCDICKYLEVRDGEEDETYCYCAFYDIPCTDANNECEEQTC